MKPEHPWDISHDPFQGVVIRSDRDALALVLWGAVKEWKLLQRHGVQIVGPGVIRVWPKDGHGNDKTRVCGLNKSEAVLTWQAMTGTLPRFLEFCGLADGDAACSRLGVEIIEA